MPYINDDHLSCMTMLTPDEIDHISGGGKAEAAGAFGMVAGIGAATFGSTWGAVALGTAIAGAPFAVAAMAGLALYGGYKLLGK